MDLFLVRMTEELTVDVPLVATGESPAVANAGGTLLHPIESVRIRALPDHLPQSIEYPVESLVDFDTTIHVRDLVIPEGATLLTDGDDIIAKVQAPRVEEVVEVPVEIGEGAPEEGEGGETPEPSGSLRLRRGLVRGLTPAPSVGWRSLSADRRPEANTIGKRIVICSGVSAARRSRNVAKEAGPNLGIERRR